MENVQKIIDAARKIIGLGNSEESENIIILDEGSCWFVSFHARGNGHVKYPKLTPDLHTTDATGYFYLNSNAGVYLNKDDLKRAVRGPEMPILSVPMISPMAERIRGNGFVGELREEQSKDNGSSTVSGAGK